MIMERKSHWEHVYERKLPTQVSWYQPRLAVSLELLARAGLHAQTRLIDVGGGASTLVDDLLEKGIRHLTVLDISGRALAASKARLGDRAREVDWIEADITRVSLPRKYDIWHDRAVFHFLTDAADRRQYLKTMRGALKPDGQVIMATFSLQGPPRCSGLDVVRYSPATLQAELGEDFRLAETLEEQHHTPFNAVQHFVYCRFQEITHPANL